jgi:hypothetical protein
MRPVPHNEALPIPKPPANVIVDDDSAPDEADLQQVGETFDCDPTYEASCPSSEPRLLTQGDLNDLVRDFSLFKKSYEELSGKSQGRKLS